MHFATACEKRGTGMIDNKICINMYKIIENMSLLTKKVVLIYMQYTFRCILFMHKNTAVGRYRHGALIDNAFAPAEAKRRPQACLQRSFAITRLGRLARIGDAPH